jgi:hypothetical protein
MLNQEDETILFTKSTKRLPVQLN